MTPTIPKSFRLASVRWRVRLVTRRYITAKLCDDKDSLGFTDWARRVIYVARDLDPVTRYLTFLHEREHAIEYTRGNDGGSERDADGRAHMLYDYEVTVRGRWDV